MPDELDVVWADLRAALLATGDKKMIANVVKQMRFMTATLIVDSATTAEEVTASLARLPSNVIPLPIPNYHPGDRNAH